MMQFREANAADAQAIALLHAESWRHSYRGMLSDQFLDEEVVDDRFAIWQKRLTMPVEGQFVLLAEAEKQLHGFACLFTNADEQYGAVLDNLHIRQASQGQGLGKILMRKTAVWLQTHHPQSSLHLWVFAPNQQAIRFYERLGGRLEGEKMETSFGKQPVRSLRYVWDDLSVIDRI